MLNILRSAHTVCLCSFVWVSEQTAIVSLNITDLLFFNNRRSAHCAVRTESVNAMEVLFLPVKGYVSSTDDSYSKPWLCLGVLKFSLKMV